MKLFAVFLLLAVFPMAYAEEGVFVSRHDIVYTLGESDFSVDELIVLENMGTASGSLFKDTIYLTRGNAWDVEVAVSGRDLGYSVKYSPVATKIKINLIIWKGEKKEVRLKYKRSDMLFRNGMIRTISGPVLGRYTWDINRAMVRFVAPQNFQFGNVTPYTLKTFDKGREVLVYDLTPVSVENLGLIKAGLPVKIEYAEYGGMAIAELKSAREFVRDAEFDIVNANKSIENAGGSVSNMTPILALFATATDMLGNSEKVLGFAEMKSDPYSVKYNPYEGYYYARKSKALARGASLIAGEAKDLANYEVQMVLEEKISDIGSKLSQQPEEEAPVEVSQSPQESGRSLFFIYVLVTLIFAAVIFGVYRFSAANKGAPAPKRSTVDDFKAIGELKYKTFEEFDKKLDTVKHGTDLAVEIRDMRRKKEKLEIEIEDLRKKKVAGRMTVRAFNLEKKKLDKQIDDTVANIGKLQKKLNKLRKVKR